MYKWKFTFEKGKTVEIETETVLSALHAAVDWARRNGPVSDVPVSMVRLPRTRKAQVGSADKVGNLSEVLDQEGETHWLAVRDSEPGDYGSIEYRTGRNFGLWFWVPDNFPDDFAR